jgi:LPXTG-site transpeptidase (sortase) family protein
MHKSLLPFLVAALIFSVLAIPGQTAYAQVSATAEMNKSFSSSFINSSGNTVLSISIYNPNAFDLTNASWTDTMPTEIKVVSIVSNNCGGIVTAVANSSSISLSGGTVPAQSGTTPGSCTVSVRVTSVSPTSTTYVFTNTIPQGSLQATGAGVSITNAGPASASLAVIHPGPPSISVVKSFNPVLVTGGGASTLSIVLINSSNTNTTLTGVTFRDDMPSGMVLASPPNFNVGSCQGTLTALSQSSFLFSDGVLPPGECTLTMSVTLTVNGNRTNVIGAGAVGTDQGINNLNPTEATLTQTNAPAPGSASISKSFSPQSIPTGSFSRLTITIQNSGNIALTGMGLSDSLPPGLVIAGGSAPAPVNNCGGGTLTAVPGTQLIQLANSSLAGNSSCTLVVPVTGSVAGVYTNTIPAGALITDPNLNITNPAPATAILTIFTGTGGGGGNNNQGRPAGTASNFLVPQTGFAPGMVTKIDTSSRPIYAATSLSLEIPVLKVNSAIVGVESKKGRWDVSWLQNQVGWLNGSAYPTWKGNSLLTAHVVGADGKPGVFSRLKALGVGEYIFVNNSGYRYTYKVVSNTLVRPNDKRVMKHEEKSYLTLITCDKYDEKTGTYLRRVVVRALLVDVRLIK